MQKKKKINMQYTHTKKNNFFPQIRKFKNHKDSSVSKYVRSIFSYLLNNFKN
jgi:hypothetical protein